jgi:hypothetical protein
VTPSSVSAVTTSMTGSVIVPVLSMQTTSTRASTSMAASSWISTLRRPSRMTLAAKATLVSNTRPSGIMAPMPATDPRIDSGSVASERSWLTMSRMAVGMIAQVIQRRIRSVPWRSSDRTSENCRAWAARSLA